MLVNPYQPRYHLLPALARKGTRKIYRNGRFCLRRHKRRIISGLTEGAYRAENAVLCDAAAGSILDVNRVAAELGLKNGSRLLLI